MYKLFLWHLYFLVADPKRFSIAEFNELISFQWQRRPDIRQNGRHELNKLKGKIDVKLSQLRKSYPKADLSILEGTVKYPVFAVAVQADGFDTAAAAMDAAFGANYNPWGGDATNWQ